MVKRQTTRRPNAAPGAQSVERIQMEDFARRLFQLMAEKRLSQSDLARKVWGEREDARGYRVARNRDRVSQYLRGTSFPEPENLKKIAKVLGVAVEDLAPDMTAEAMAKERPAINMTMIAGHPNKVHLVVNQLVTLTEASAVIALLSKYKDAELENQSERAMEVVDDDNRPAPIGPSPKHRRGKPT